MSNIVSKNNNNYGLNDKQERFCLEYLKDFNGTQAAIRAGYSKSTANEQSSALLAKLNIQNRIRDLNAKIEKSTIMDIQEIYERLTKMARGDLEEDCIVVVGDGDGFSSPRNVKKQITPKDQAKALELLGKANGMFIEKVQASVTSPNLECLQEYFKEKKNNGKDIHK